MRWTYLATIIHHQCIVRFVTRPAFSNALKAVMLLILVAMLPWQNSSCVGRVGMLCAINPVVPHIGWTFSPTHRSNTIIPTLADWIAQQTIFLPLVSIVAVLLCALVRRRRVYFLHRHFPSGTLDWRSRRRCFWYKDCCIIQAQSCTNILRLDSAAARGISQPSAHRILW